MRYNGNVLVLTYWDFSDALIQTYTVPYVKLMRKYLNQNSSCYLVTFDNPNKTRNSEREGRLLESLTKAGIEVVRFKYYPFSIKALISNSLIFVKLLSFIFKNKIQVIHTWCTPAGGLGALLSKITCRKLIIDSFEPHADTMLESGAWSASSFAFKLLFWLEKYQVKRADIAIGCVATMKNYSIDRLGVNPKLFYWKPACVDFENFKYNPIFRESERDKRGISDCIVGLYAGKFGPPYLTSEIFDLFVQAYKKWGDSFRLLLLNNQEESYIEELAHKAGFDSNLIIKVFVPHEEVDDFMSMADFALTPFVPIPSKRYGTPIKTGEYMAIGLPIIITNHISDDSDYIRDNELGYVLKSLTEEEYTNSIKYIDSIITKEGLPGHFRSKVTEACMKYRNFDIAEKVYKDIYH